MSGTGFATVLAPVEQSDASWRALNMAFSLCEEAGATLILLAAVDLPAQGAMSVAAVEEVRRDRLRTLNTSIRQATVFASYAGIHTTTVTAEGPVWKAVVRYVAAHETDLIILARRRGLLRGRLLPSTADFIIRRVTCPVMVV